MSLLAFADGSLFSGPVATQVHRDLGQNPRLQENSQRSPVFRVLYSPSIHPSPDLGLSDGASKSVDVNSCKSTAQSILPTKFNSF